MESNRCMCCMGKLEEGVQVCPHCGYDPKAEQQSEIALPPGTILHGGKYLVGKVLGQGGFGITYVGMDLALELKIAIKEYYPFHMASRSGDSVSLTWRSSQEDRDVGRESL